MGALYDYYELRVVVSEYYLASCIIWARGGCSLFKVQIPRRVCQRGKAFLWIKSEAPTKVSAIKRYDKSHYVLTLHHL